MAHLGKKKEIETLESFQTPEMSKEQRQESLKAFGLFVQHAESQRSDLNRLKSRLLQLKYQMEDFIRENNSAPPYGFGYFLREYINTLDIKNKDFADEIDLAPTVLSHILSRRRSPSEEFIIRLELHSNLNFPAIMWYRILEKEKEQEIINNAELRKEQSKHVRRKLEFSL